MRNRKAAVVAIGATVIYTIAVASSPISTIVEFRVEEATIAEIHSALKGGSLTCVDLVKAYLDRIRAYEEGGPRLNSITTVNPKALDGAAALDAKSARGEALGSLHCIPVLLKDNIDMAGMPTTNGSVIMKDAVPPQDAAIVRTLKAAGALILGKAAMGEFAGGSYNTIDGQTLNPYHFRRATGGSSSGSGAAVAANFAVLAVGTDTSTSVRGPAAFTGIVGLRPTTGLISRAGIAPKNLNFDSAGPLARTVTDTAILLNALAGPDPADPLSLDVYAKYPASDKRHGRYADFTRYLKRGALKGVRLGVLRDFFRGDPEIDALAETALAKMRELGATLVDVRLDPQFLDEYVRDATPNIRRISDYRFRADWESYLQRFGPTVPKTTAEFVKVYETEVARSPLPVEASVLDLLKRGLATSMKDPEYRHLMTHVLPTATKLQLGVFEQHRVDALVFPYNVTFAPPISNPVRRVEDSAYVPARGRLSPATLAGYSSVGFPGIVVPMGFGTQGLPAAISFMGRPYDEGRILGYAYDYEQATRLRRPSPLLPAVKSASSAPMAACPPGHDNYQRSAAVCLPALALPR